MSVLDRQKELEPAIDVIAKEFLFPSTQICTILNSMDGVSLLKIRDLAF